ncbi:MAG: MBL fold metallo-hydrolase [Balneolaceae bacterium]|nr:MBL fold metallo-hydrolase [Balneolaceae bacterium]
MKSLFIFLALLMVSVSLSAQSEITIRYIGNMGVLISDANNSVLIEGLHDEYRAESYTFPSDEVVQTLITKDGSEFPPITAVMATHFHQDHFDEALINRFLDANEYSVFIGSEQAVSEIDAGKDQLIPISTATYQKQSVNLNGVKITSFYLNHVNPGRFDSIQNVGFLVEINGFKILHIGDTNWFEEAFTAAELTALELDLAIMPFWMLMREESKANFSKCISADKIIATHLFYKDFEAYEKDILTFFPDATLFTQPNESITLKK